jgi:hypothetical protein
MSCIIVFRHPYKIILATDSRSTSVGEGARALIPSTNGGKLGQYGPWTLALCGFSRGPGVPDVRAALGRGLAGAATLDAAVRGVQGVFVSELLPALAQARHYRAFADLFAAVNGTVLAVLIAGLEDGRPVLGSFGADFDPQSGQAKMYGGALPASVTHYAIGQQLALDLTTTEPRPAWLERGDAAAARRLLEMQAAATPRYVAPPFHVKEITSCLQPTN